MVIRKMLFEVGNIIIVNNKTIRGVKLLIIGITAPLLN